MEIGCQLVDSLEGRKEGQDIMGEQNFLMAIEEIHNIFPFLVRVKSPISASFFSSLGPASSIPLLGFEIWVSLLKNFF